MRMDIMNPLDESESNDMCEEPWQLALLDMNPAYTCQDIHEDYMADGSEWAAPIIAHSWPCIINVVDAHTA